MKKIIIKIAITAIACSAHFAYAGSYLFCAKAPSPERTVFTDWFWPRVLEQDINDSRFKLRNITVVYKGDTNNTENAKGGFWFSGTMKNDSLMNYYLKLDDYYNNASEAIQLCKTFINKCQEDRKQLNLKNNIPDDSHQFTHLGVASHSIPINNRGIIELVYNNGKDQKSISCPNQQYKDYSDVSYIQAATVFGYTVLTTVVIMGGGASIIVL